MANSPSIVAAPTSAMPASRAGTIGPVATPPAGRLGASLGALSAAGGNRAVAGLLTGGSPLPGHLLADMETRFGQSFGQVRIHDDPAAHASAAGLNAKAYTVGHDIVFSTGRFAPQSSSGKRLLAHELAHVVQQRRGGRAPTLEAGAGHEHSADAAANGYASGTGPISVGGATGVGIARLVEDWLHGTVDSTNWRYSDLENEREELRQWLDRQLATDERTLRVEEAMNLLDLRIGALREGVRGPQKMRKTLKNRGRKGAKGRGATAKADDVSATSEFEIEPPRCLIERSSVVFDDPEEMREEFDRIVAWLQRKDVPAGDRSILQTQLDNLAPLLGQNLQQRAQERRRTTINRALTPTGTGDARTSIREAVRLVDSIKPVAGRNDQYYLMHGDEMITLTRDEALGIRAATMDELQKAAKKVWAIKEEALNAVAAQASVEREHSFAAWGTSLFTDKTTWELLDEFLLINDAAVDACLRVTYAQRRDDLMRMAEELANAEELALKGRLLVRAHIRDILDTGDNIVTGLEITKGAAFTIVMIGTAGAAAPAIGAGLAGAGITGATATGLTALGTATVVGAEGFFLGGGTRTAGELAAGHSLEESVTAGLDEGLATAETGVKIGLSTVAAPLVAARFSVGAQGVGRVGNAVRSGAATGTTNLAVEAGTRAVVHQELLSPTDAGSTFLGGAVGGFSGRATQGLKNPLMRGATNVMVGAGSSGAATYAATGDIDKALQSAAIGGATSLAVGKPPQPSTKTLNQAFATGQKVRGSMRSAKQSERVLTPDAESPVQPAPAVIPIGSGKGLPQSAASKALAATLAKQAPGNARTVSKLPVRKTAATPPSEPAQQKVPVVAEVAEKIAVGQTHGVDGGGGTVSRSKLTVVGGTRSEPPSATLRPAGGKVSTGTSGGGAAAKVAPTGAPANRGGTAKAGARSRPASATKGPSAKPARPARSRPAPASKRARTPADELADFKKMLWEDFGAKGNLTSDKLTQLYRHGNRAAVSKHVRQSLMKQAQALSGSARKGPAVLEIGDFKLELKPGQPIKTQVNAFVKKLEGAHSMPQAFGKKLPGDAVRDLPGGKYNPDDALVQLTDKPVHTAMDQPWKDAFNTLRKSGATETTGGRVFEMVADGIRKTPGMSDSEKASRIARLHDEMFTEMKLDPNRSYSVPRVYTWLEILGFKSKGKQGGP